MSKPTAQNRPSDRWAKGEAYEPFVGRWSRLVAPEFLAWLNVPADSRWLDVGCGTGALTHAILQHAHPRHVTAIDSAPGYVASARSRLADARIRFEVAEAEALPLDSEVYDAAVSGLVLNFIPQPARAVQAMAGATRPGGVVAAYVWDYGGGMQLMRHFWNAAAALDPAAYGLDEGRRFPLCQPEPLGQLFRETGLREVDVRPIDVATRFQDFDDFWSPFLGGEGPAPSYTMSLSEEKRAALRERLRDSLPLALDGSIPLVARAWAVRGAR